MVSVGRIQTGGAKKRWGLPLGAPGQEAAEELTVTADVG